MSSIGRVTRFGLRNFKAFHYLEDIELKPLTVLVGANSSGKSSIFQALLLLKQSSEAGPSGGLLKFNGDWTRLGSFGSVVSDFDVSRTIECRFETETSVTAREFPGYDASATSSSIMPARSIIQFEFGLDRSSSEIVLQRMTIRTNLEAVEDDKSVLLEYDRSKPLVSQNALPRSWALRGKVGTPSELMFDRFWLDELIYKFETERGELNSAPPLIEALAVPVYALRGELEEHLEYLGPIRADPRPFYPVEEEPTIGPRGDGTIPYLLRRQHEMVRYAPSPVDALREAPLLEAVNDWLRRMKVTSSLTIDPVESIAFTAAIRSTSATTRSVNLSQVGFGVSQLLPVLVMGLKGPSDGWLLFEQPESQLHPRLQGELGDFLLATARAGKTVMVETHSDHLVNRLRRRIAEDETGELAKMVQILFVHAGTPDNPSSYVEPLAVDASGTIVNCPPDFFSETSDEAFAILNARRKRPAKGP